MKNFAIALFLILTSATIAQVPSGNMEQCGHEQILLLQKNQNPHFQESLNQLNVQIEKYTNSSVFLGKNALSISGSAIRVIPVVVHIVRNPTDPLGVISYAQIESQIEALNAAFSKTYATYNGQTHGPDAVDTKIQFCLAQNTSGAAAWSDLSEPGVMRYDDATRAANNMTVASTDDLLNLTHPTAAHFPFENFLNIWVVQSINGLCSGVQGYALSPILEQIGVYGFNLDGVVMRADIFGDNSTGNNYDLQPHNFYGASCYSSYASSNEGKVLAHEVGHYLNLFHTFQNDILTGAMCAGDTPTNCSQEGDFVCDTPPSSISSTHLCGTANPNSCGSPDMTENYMYYSQDPCLNTFTSGQVDRMTAYLDLYRPELSAIENQISAGIRGSAGCIPPELLADFNYSGGSCTGNAISLASISAPANLATSFQWSCPNGIIANPTASNTTITFANPGNYLVTLSVDDGSGPISSSQILAVTICQLNADLVNQTHWYYGQYCSVDFSSGSPVPTDDAPTHQTIFAEEAAYAYSDDTGALVFYTDGINLWDSSHTQLNVGQVFPTVAMDYNWLTLQDQSYVSVHGLTGIPFPGHPNEFYLFCAPSNEDYLASGATEIRAVHVDMNTGTVGAAVDLTAIGTRLSEALVIIPHCNGQDFWIIFHSFDGFFAGGVFHKCLLTPLGFTAVTTSPAFSYSLGTIADIKGSRDNTALIVSGGNQNVQSKDLATYSFDNATGVISNEQIYDAPGPHSFYGCSFSPNGEQLYGSALITGDVVQFDRATGASTVLGTVNWPVFMQLGPDDNLYIATGPPNGVRTASISNPNIPNNVGSFNPNAINFSGTMPNGGFSNLMVPKLLDGIVPSLLPADYAYTYQSCNEVQFAIDPCWSHYDVNWNFNDGFPGANGTSVSRTFLLPGTYNVVCTLSIPGSMDEIIIEHQVTIYDSSPAISGPTSVCEDDINPSTYNVPLYAGYSYNWTVSNGSLLSPNGGSQIDVDWASGVTGTISVDIVTDNCSRTSSQMVNINFCSLATNDLSKFGLQIYPNPATDALTIARSFDSKEVVEIELLDISLRAIRKGKLMPGSPDISIDVRDLSVGTYFLQMIIGDHIVLERVEKN